MAFMRFYELSATPTAEEKYNHHSNIFVNNCLNWGKISERIICHFLGHLWYQFNVPEKSGSYLYNISLISCVTKTDISKLPYIPLKTIGRKV